MAGVRQHGWRAIPAVRSEYGADTLLERYRSTDSSRLVRTAELRARLHDRCRRTWLSNESGLLQCIKLMNYTFLHYSEVQTESYNLISLENINNFLWRMHDARLIACNVIFIT